MTQTYTNYASGPRVDHIPADHIPMPRHHEPAACDEPIRIPPGTRLDELERLAIRQALEHCAGHRRQTAELLGISVRTLQRRLKSFAVLARSR
jgi:DNA-binding NtrC family response regulator